MVVQLQGTGRNHTRNGSFDCRGNYRGLLLEPLAKRSAFRASRMVPTPIVIE